MEVKNEKDNPLMQRTEVEAELSQFDVTPSRKQVFEELKNKYKSANIVIDKIDHAFGSKRAKVIAKVYSSVEAMKEYSSAYKLERTEGKKDGGKAKEKA